MSDIDLIFYLVFAGLVALFVRSLVLRSLRMRRVLKPILASLNRDQEQLVIIASRDEELLPKNEVVVGTVAAKTTQGSYHCLLVLGREGLLVARTGIVSLGIGKSIGRAILSVRADAKAKKLSAMSIQQMMTEDSYNYYMPYSGIAAILVQKGNAVFPSIVNVVLANKSVRSFTVARFEGLVELVQQLIPSKLRQV